MGEARWFVGWARFCAHADSININTVGGCPTASYFLLLRQKESSQRKGDPGLYGSAMCILTLL